MNNRLSKEELLKMLNDNIEFMKFMPSEHMNLPITSYELCNVLEIITDLFEAIVEERK